MAWTRKLASGRYQGLYRDAQGKQRTVDGTYTHKDAARDEALRQEGIARHNPKVTSRMTFDEWEPLWKASRRVAAGTADGDESKLRNHVRPRWDGIKLSAITTGEVQTWLADLHRPKTEGGKGLAVSTVKKCFHLLSAMMTEAVKAKVLDVNPCRAVDLKPYREPDTPDRFLTEDEVSAIREGLDGINRLVFDVLVGTGARWGEAMALAWDHVDLDNHTVTIGLSYDRTNKFVKPVKGHAQRGVPIGDSLFDVLSVRLDEVGYGHTPKMDYQGVKVSSQPRYALILANSVGLPVDGANFAKVLSATAKGAAVGEGRRKRHVGHVRPHDLRHTFGSRLVQKGIPIDVVQKLLGHRDLSTTARYARRDGSEADAIRKALG